VFYNYNLAFNLIFAVTEHWLTQHYTIIISSFFYKYFLFEESDLLMSLLRYVISFTYFQNHQGIFNLTFIF